MKLTLDQIRSVARGIVDVGLDEDGLIRLYRMLPYQQEIYRAKSEAFFYRSRNSSGVVLAMKTDSQHLTMDVSMSRCCGRDYFGMDVCVDGRLTDSLTCFGHDKMFTDHRKTFKLGKGTKTVSVYMPWSVICKIRSVEIDDGAKLAPVPRQKKLLAFGDSITEGFDCLHPSRCYVAKVADWLDAECFNKGNGGEVYDPDIVKQAEPIDPDYITVAYGTNDWNRVSRESFHSNCNLFIGRLGQHYPTAKIFILAPIWRKVWQDKREFGPFRDVAKELESACKKLDNGIFIDCFDFVPLEEQYFWDQRLHPNDEGFDHYFQNLKAAMTPYL